MAYLGRQPLVGNYQVLDALTASATATYALTKNSVAVFPQTPANCIVSLNGVIQAPFDSYTISGSNIVFASALTGSDSIDFITVLGDVLNIGTPSDGTVTTAKLADSSVSLAKLTATGTKDATTFLRGDNTFASAGGTNTPAFLVGQTSGTSVPNTSFTKLLWNNEDFDIGGGFDLPNNKFVVPAGEGGKYHFTAWINGSSAVGYDRFHTAIYVNGSSANFAGSADRYSNHAYPNVPSGFFSGAVSFLYNASVGDYFEVFLYQDSGGTITTNPARTWFYGYKLIE
jgi:hypothetical protein